MELLTYVLHHLLSHFLTHGALQSSTSIKPVFSHLREDSRVVWLYRDCVQQSTFSFQKYDKLFSTFGIFSIARYSTSLPYHITKVNYLFWNDSTASEVLSPTGRYCVCPHDVQCISNYYNLAYSKLLTDIQVPVLFSSYSIKEVWSFSFLALHLRQTLQDYYQPYPLSLFISCITKDIFCSTTNCLQFPMAKKVRLLFRESVAPQNLRPSRKNYFAFSYPFQIRYKKIHLELASITGVICRQTFPLSYNLCNT